MKYYIIAGEASGDLHGSNLIKQLLLQDASATIRCWGGNLMEAASNTIVVKHYKDLAFMGFAEVVKNLPTILKNIRFCKDDIVQFSPNVLVLIDYPGFNLRIAQWAKQQGIKVVYYISPQVWAWKANRVKKMKQCIDKMMVILPFEKNYFKEVWQWDVEYVGHPLIEVIETFNSTKHTLQISSSKPIIALLPGSRKQEIEKKLPIMLSVCKHFTDYAFVVAKAPGQDDDFYHPFLANYTNVYTVSNTTYALLQHATAAIVTSGTATLETALFKVPQIVCYKSSNISYAIGKQLIKIKFISLVNLIANQLVVKELIQQALTEENLKIELANILPPNTNRNNIIENYNSIYKLLAQEKSASTKAAQLIFEVANNTSN
jgi:lipid-A-disaccharide synthase